MEALSSALHGHPETNTDGADSHLKYAYHHAEAIICSVYKNCTSHFDYNSVQNSFSGCTETWGAGSGSVPERLLEGGQNHNP